MQHDLNQFFNRRLSAGLFLFAFAIVGCGKGKPQETYPASGVVLWSDGQPASELEGALVAFEPSEGGHVRGFPTGAMQADGTFVLKTYQPDDGAPLGKYRVAVMPSKPRDPDFSSPPREIIDKRFQNYATSGLEVTIKPETNQLRLTVERASKR